MFTKLRTSPRTLAYTMLSDSAIAEICKTVVSVATLLTVIVQGRKTRRHVIKNNEEVAQDISNKIDAMQTSSPSHNIIDLTMPPRDGFRATQKRGD